MQLPSLNYDLWRLMTLEDCISGTDAMMPGTPTLQRSPAAIPYAADLQTLQRGDGAKLIFQIAPTPEEMASGQQYRIQQMWVAVAERYDGFYIGILNSHFPDKYANRDFYLRNGAEIPFLPQHIVDINHPPSGFDIETILQPQKTWSREDTQSLVMGDPVLSELLDLAARNAVKLVKEEACPSAFGIGHTTGKTWSDRLISTGVQTQDGSDGLSEAVYPLQERVRQKTLLASAVCNYRRLQRASGETADSIVILLENAAGYSVYWVQTYHKTTDGYKFDDLVAQFGEPIVFVP